MDENLRIPAVRFASVTLDCPDREQLADFYATLLGWEKKQFDEEWLGVVSPDGAVCLFFQETEDYVRPVWPNGPGRQQQMEHLDFAADPAEREFVTRHVLSCGAVMAPMQYYRHSTVFLDPAGHPFCIGFFG